MSGTKCPIYFLFFYQSIIAYLFCSSIPNLRVYHVISKDPKATVKWGIPVHISLPMWKISNDENLPHWKIIVCRLNIKITSQKKHYFLYHSVRFGVNFNLISNFNSTHWNLLIREITNNLFLNEYILTHNILYSVYHYYPTNMCETLYFIHYTV